MVDIHLLIEQGVFGNEKGRTNKVNYKKAKAVVHDPDVQVARGGKTLLAVENCYNFTS